VTIQEVVAALGLEVAAGEVDSREVTGGYVSDLLSCVMAGASAGNVWVTLQAHPNVVAVADLLGLSGVIITENARPDEETIGRANEKNVPLLLTPKGSFAVVAHLAQMGIQGAE
jgi:hypothetical protein